MGSQVSHHLLPNENMAAQFGSNPDLNKLNNFLLDKAYIQGWEFSAEDVAVFNAVKAAPSADLVNALRWWNHVKSYESEFGNVKASPAAVEEEEDDDDVDLFGSDSEDDAEAERVKAERVAAYNARKEAKEAVKGKAIAKSSISFDVKPWDDETDLKEVETMCRAIEMDGLVWGSAQLKPIGYGIMKLRITCVVEDAKVSSDDLVEQIEGFEDHVQSVDIAAFQKI